MNWEIARLLADDHQARLLGSPPFGDPDRAPRVRLAARARCFLGWALVDLGLKLAVGRRPVVAPRVVRSP
jgi:hypothetical protein